LHLSRTNNKNMEDKLDLILKEIASLHAKIDNIEDKLYKFNEDYVKLSNNIIDHLNAIDKSTSYVEMSNNLNTVRNGSKLNNLEKQTFIKKPTTNQDRVNP
jgi:hypothetical protein